MQSINLAWFSRLANAIRPVASGGFDAENCIEVFASLQQYLVVLADKNQFPLSIDASRPIVWALQEHIDAVTASPSNSLHAELQARRGNIQEQAARLNMVLDTDLGHQPVFHVFPKRAYDVAVLTSDATQLFSPQARVALSEEESFNIVQAGRCLAFEVPTAAAFHLFRAMDSVLQRYVRTVAGKMPKAKNWGSYIRTLEASDADKKIVGIVNHIREYFRNPIIHPEARVSVEQALSLVGVAESAITMMAEDILERTLPPVDDGDLNGLG